MENKVFSLKLLFKYPRLKRVENNLIKPFMTSNKSKGT